MKKIWFERRNQWYICSWQGWFFIFVWIALNTFILVNIINYGWLETTIFLVLSGILLVYIFNKKGEKRD
jgi:hypothetical protein